MLEVRELSKRYGGVVALDRASFDATPGRLVGFVGPNGAGKSTTMRSIFGLVAPDAGSIRWNGQPTDEVDRSAFGYLPEQRGLYPKMKIARQVQFFAEIKGLSTAEAKERTVDILTMLELGDRLGHPLEALSHGNQQRVQLAVALVHDPRLLILDEPFNGLDPVAVEVLRGVLRERADAGATVVFSSHQLDLVEQLCDDLVVISEGSIRATGTVREVRRSTNEQIAVVEVEQPISRLADSLAGLDLLSTETFDDRSVARISLRSTSQLGGLVAAARSCGELTSLTYEPPSLTDIFKELV